jgi:hypothetical protein
LGDFTKSSHTLFIHHFIGIEHQNPLSPSSPQRLVARFGKIVLPGDRKDPCSQRSSHRFGLIRRAGIHHHQVVEEFRNLRQVLTEVLSFISHDHAQRKKRSFHFLSVTTKSAEIFPVRSLSGIEFHGFLKGFFRFLVFSLFKKSKTEIIPGFRKMGVLFHRLLQKSDGFLVTALPEGNHPKPVEHFRMVFFDLRNFFKKFSCSGGIGGQKSPPSFLQKLFYVFLIPPTVIDA